MSNHTGSLFSSFQLPSSSTREYRRQQQQSTNNTNSINSQTNKNQSTNSDVTTRTSSTTTGNGNNGTNSSSNTAPPSRPLLESEDRAANLTHAQISQYFNLPLHEAIVQLRVDEGSLKRRCRQLGISRWPYRKRVNLLKSKNNNAAAAADIRNVAITPMSGIRSQFHQYNLHTMSSPSPSPMDTSNQMTDDDEHEQPSSQQQSSSSSSHVHHQSTTMNSSPSSKLKEVKKKAADSLFKCFQVFKAPNKEPSPQKMTQEEHQRKQSTMQGEFNSKLEPVAEPPRTSQQQPQQHQHLPHPQPSYHHNSDNNNYQYPQQPHSDDFNSNHEGYSATRWQQPMNNNQDAYWKKGGNGDHQQPPPQQQQQQLTGSPPSIMSKLHQYHTQASNNHVRPYHQEHPTPSTPHQFNHNHFNSNYHQYPQPQQQGSYSSSSSRVAPSPHLQPLPSISDMLASIHEDENMMNKKRSRRDSADQVYQQQFAGPTKKLNSPSIFDMNRNHNHNNNYHHNNNQHQTGNYHFGASHYITN